MQNKQTELITLDTEDIQDRIYFIRGKKVMIDRDLAMLYGVLTKRLNQAVKRNIKRFPEDFMFIMSNDEMENWKSQFVTSNFSLIMSLRKPPQVFTEQGIAMLSSVLNSDRAIDINIQIIRIFTKLRSMIDSYKELREKVEKMEEFNEINFSKIFKIINYLIREEVTPKEKIGFRTE